MIWRAGDDIWRPTAAGRLVLDLGFGIILGATVLALLYRPRPRLCVGMAALFAVDIIVAATAISGLYLGPNIVALCTVGTVAILGVSLRELRRPVAPLGSRASLVAAALVLLLAIGGSWWLVVAVGPPDRPINYGTPPGGGPRLVFIEADANTYYGTVDVVRTYAGLLQHDKAIDVPEGTPIEAHWLNDRTIVVDGHRLSIFGRSVYYEEGP